MPGPSVMLDQVTTKTSEDRLIDIDKLSLRLGQAMAVRDAYNLCRNYYDQWRDARDARNVYYVTVEENDDLFDQVKKLLFKSIPIEEQKTVNAEVRHNYRTDAASLVLYNDNELPTSLNIDGHDVTVEITTQKPGANKPSRRGSSAGDSLDELLKPTVTQVSGYLGKRAIFTCNSLAARDAVVRRLEQFITESTARNPRFYAASSLGGGWRAQDTKIQRPLDSVVLAEGQKERVIADLENFIASEDRYIELGLPWHRGFLFHGAPGTGKTSLATAMAAHFKLDVYVISLSSINDDSKLMDLVTGISGRALLVLEDIDIVHAARDRDDSKKGATLAGLLNALDGVATPHGLITVMTTNNIDALDPALIRPGRVDLSLEVSHIDDAQFQALCERFIGRNVVVPRIRGEITPAEVVGLFKDGDSPDLDDELYSLVNRKNMTTASRQKDVKNSVQGVRY